MSTLSQFLGGSGVPIGSYVPVPATYTPQDVVSANGKEYLSGGKVVAYAAKYANTITEAPWLGVRMGTAFTFSAGTAYYDIVENTSGSIIVICGSAANTIHTCTNGDWATFTARTIGSSGHYPAACRFDAASNTFCLLGAVSGTFGIYTSTDAVTWTSRFNQATTTSFSSYYGADRLVAYASNLALWMCMYRNDIATGVAFARGAGADPATATWTAVGAGTTISSYFTTSVSGICASPDIFVVWGDGPSVCTSTTGATNSWTTRSLGSGGSFIIKVVWTGQRFIAVDNTYAWFKSSDGITWTPMTAYPNAGTLDPNYLYSNQNGFLVTHYYGGGGYAQMRTWVSNDHGDTWQPLIIAFPSYPSSQYVRWSGRHMIPNYGLGTSGYRFSVASLLPSATPSHVGTREALTISAGGGFVPLFRIL